MKKAVKSLLIVALLAIGSFSTANAQFGIQAGYVNAQLYHDGDKVNDSYNGFEVGVSYNMPIMGGFSLQYALLYTFQTVKYEYAHSSLTDVDLTSTGHFLNLPVRAAYAFPITNDFSIFLYGGPNFTLGLGGRDKLDGDLPGVDIDRETKWYDDDLYNRFDIKLGLGLGLQYINIILKGGYDWGLIDQADGSANLSRNQFNISLVYQF